MTSKKAQRRKQEITSQQKCQEVKDKEVGLEVRMGSKSGDSGLQNNDLSQRINR